MRMRSEASRRDTWRVDYADWSTILRENFRLKRFLQEAPADAAELQ